MAESVAKHLQRDARAAAHHIAKGLAHISKDDAELDKQITEASDKVSEAIAKTLADADVTVEVES